MIGSIYVYALFIVLLFLFDPSWTFLSLTWMLLLTTLIALPIKYWWKTPRPKKIKPKHWWNKLSQGSFPSAHAARASGLLTIAVVSGNWLFIVFSALFAAAVSYSRVELRMHFWKDIAGGLVLGIICGIAAYYLAAVTFHFFVSSPEVIVYEIN